MCIWFINCSGPNTGIYEETKLFYNIFDGLIESLLVPVLSAERHKDLMIPQGDKG